MFAIATSVLGSFLIIGLTLAAGSDQSNNLIIYRDVVLGLLLGILALRSGRAMRRCSTKALQHWEVYTWVIALAALVMTVVSTIWLVTGPEYVVFAALYTALAASATAMRKRLS